jgi:hypothetical protein
LMLNDRFVVVLGVLGGTVHFLLNFPVCVSK